MQVNLPVLDNVAYFFYCSITLYRARPLQIKYGQVTRHLFSHAMGLIIVSIGTIILYADKSPDIHSTNINCYVHLYKLNKNRCINRVDIVKCSECSLKLLFSDGTKTSGPISERNSIQVAGYVTNLLCTT